MKQSNIYKLFHDIESKKDSTRYDALKKLLSITENKVVWIYERLSALFKKLDSDNSYQ